ncbi:type II toxin-antitoxin system RelE family toxin [Xylanimonas protaetiae]|uniref:Type II toxin-antitoxin system RelE/ParE family toxin n=1 Tax=Xylanimonas protaetiae TaxID=2509457 RepID=A0A4P6F5R0_9MICO|nr:type II toxin-antitoxin system RelE/ParE family toxin [Xylanimonas protaetiae]QAY70715.1 type II toxin-antitoxin system RelE/ParE family toxin [Xylanimonas protaetiae]
MTAARILLLDEAKEDLRDLNGTARRIIAKGIEKLRTEPAQRGAPVGSRSAGNSTGLRRLVVGNREFRIVYDVRDDGTIVVVWVIERRVDDEVYRLAVSRLETYRADPQKSVILRQMLDTAWGR